MAYNEIEQRGTADFPFAFFHLNESSPRYNMAAHWHSEVEIIRVLKGEFHVTLNSKTYIAKEGDFIFVNSNTVHRGTPINCEYECIVFHADFLYSDEFDCHSFIKNLLDGECIINEIFPSDNAEFSAALSSIFASVTSDANARKFRVIASFYSFFALVYEKQLFTQSMGSNSFVNDPKIITLKKIISFLRKNYDKQISLEMLSGAVNKSPKYVGCFFKQMTGKTPIEYLNEYRIEKACHKLLYTDLAVTDIAFSCGFSDLSYFIKTFKKTKGVSPGKYRST